MLNCQTNWAVVEQVRKLPKIHARRQQYPDKLFKVEILDLEFSNGKKRSIAALYIAREYLHKEKTHAGHKPGHKPGTHP